MFTLILFCGIVVNWIRNKHPLISSGGVFLYKNQKYGISNAIKKKHLRNIRDAFFNVLSFTRARLISTGFYHNAFNFFFNNAFYHRRQIFIQPLFDLC